MQETPIELQDLGCSQQLSDRLQKADKRCKAIRAASPPGTYACLALVIVELVEAVCSAIWDACKNSRRNDGLERKCHSAMALLECCLDEAEALVVAPKPTSGAHKSSRNLGKIKRLVLTSQAELCGLGCTLQGVDDWKRVSFYSTFCDVEAAVAFAVAGSTPGQSGRGPETTERDDTRSPSESALVQVEDGSDVPDVNVPAQSSSNNARSNAGDGCGVPHPNAQARRPSNNARSNTWNGRGIPHANAPARNPFHATNTGGVREPGLNGNAIPEVPENQDRRRTPLSAYTQLGAGARSIMMVLCLVACFGIGVLVYDHDQPRWMDLTIIVPFVAAAVLALLVFIGITIRACLDARSDN